MSNRYSKTGFTAREDARLMQMELAILNLIRDRSGKNDDRNALSQLYAAQSAISQAKYLSKEWVKWN